jgi:cytochrome bd-type quinol oxidase subunit 2
MAFCNKGLYNESMNFLNLDGFIKWAFASHALLGSLALLILAVPLFTKKGGKLHVKTGWIYSYSMIFVGLSAFAITAWRIFFDEGKNTGSVNFAVFLSYVSIFTLASIAFGILSLKFKNRSGPSRDPLHLIPPAITIAAGVAVQILGFKYQSYLLMIFPFLGHATSKSQLQYWLTVPTSKRHWWYAHMDGMVTACIATITAFLVTAVPRLWPGPVSESFILWVAPGLILGTLLNRWKKNYRAQFEPALKPESLT